MTSRSSSENEKDCAGLLASIQRLAVAEPGELDQAIRDFDTIAKPILIPMIARELHDKKLPGPGSMVEDAGDILQDLNIKLTLKGAAAKCDAPTDQRAKAWLITTVKNVIEDKAKTPRRRYFKWRPVFEHARQKFASQQRSEDRHDLQ